MMQVDDQLNKEMNKAKAAMMSNKALTFFTTIIFSLKFKWDACGTAWVDGYSMGWDPAWFMSLTRDERVGVMAHEAYHIALDHLSRRSSRIPGLWNIACDHAINLDLEAKGFKLPKPNCCDGRFKGMSADQIYKILVDENQPDNNPQPDMRDAPDDKKPEEVKRHIEDIIIRAATQARMTGHAGTIPGDVEVFLESLLAPRLPWQSIIRREVNKLVRGGTTWKLPNRRFFPKHYLPANWSEQPGELDVYLDISGSVSDYQFTIFVSELAGVLKMFKLQRMRIIQFNTRITKIDTVKSIRQLGQVSFKGRGGTDPECIFEDMEKHKPRLAIVFTDGEFGWRRKALPGQNLIWLINDNPGFVPLFGRAVHFDT